MPEKQEEERTKVSVYMRRDLSDWLSQYARLRGVSKSALLASMVYDARERERERSALRGGVNG